MSPQIAIIVSTYERPQHLARSLFSIAQQREGLERLEVIVTDDGSRDHTREVVEEFAGQAPFPVHWVTQPHHGFRLARARNAAVAASSADFLIFTDADCVLPPDHVACHLRQRRPKCVNCGDGYRLDEARSEQVTLETIREDRLSGLVTDHELKRVRSKARRARIYQWLGLKMRPRLTGLGFGIWRRDFEAVNGFDEMYVGWGLEDVDLQRRLLRIGVRCQTILHRTVAYHLWHPVAPSFVRNCEGTPNLRYYQENRRGPIRPARGLDQHLGQSVAVEWANPVTALRMAAYGRAA